MKKLALLLIIFSLSPRPVKAEWNPGHWGETSIPKNILTQADYAKYTRARKTTKTTAVICGVVALSLLKYSSDMDRKARRISVTESVMVPHPAGYGYYPIRQSSMDFRGRMLSKSSGAKQAAAVAGVASLFLAAFTLSISF